MERDPVMAQCVKKSRVMFWGNLSEAESKEYIALLEKRRNWYYAWDQVMASTTKYGFPPGHPAWKLVQHKPYDGPSAWMPDKDLHRMNDLQRKGWGMLNGG